jgi:hypothetical protein
MHPPCMNGFKSALAPTLAQNSKKEQLKDGAVFRKELAMVARLLKKMYRLYQRGLESLC